METASFKQKTIFSLFWKVFERGSVHIVSLIVQLFLARLLSPDMFGALAVMLVFINIGNVFAVAGFNTAIIQNPTIDDDDCSTIFWISFSVALFLYVVIFIAAPYIASFYNTDSLVGPLRVFSVTLILNVYYSIQSSIVQRNLNFKIIFKTTLVSVSISGVVGIITAFYGFGLWALVAQQVLNMLIICIMLTIQVPWRPKFVFKADRAKEFFCFGWKLMVSGLLDVGYQGLSDLIVGKQFSQADLGYFSQGKKIPMMTATMLDGSIQPVMLSAVSRVQDDISYVKRLVRRALKTSSYIIFPCMTMLALFAEPFIRLVLGEQWLPSVYFMQIYCVVFALFPVHTSNLQALNAMGRSDLFLKLEVIKKSYGIIFILVAVFIFNDIYLLAASYLICSIIATFVNAYPNKKVIGYSYIQQIRDISPGIILSLVSAAIAFPISLLGLHDVITILLQAMIVLASYILLSKLFHVEELDYLVITFKEIFNSKFSKH